MSSLPHREPPRARPDAAGTPADHVGAGFDALVRAHYGRLCNFAVRFVQSRDLAEDIVQDVLVSIWQRQAEFTHDDPLPYLYQAVRNRAANHARGQRVRDRWRAATEQAEVEPAPSAASEAEAAELADVLARAVASLPERCRLVFTMSREQELTYPQIARILGISIKTVEAQMGRALKTLRSRVAGYLSLTLTIVSTGRWLG